MHVEPQEQHRWLQKLVGEWTYEHESCAEPGKPPEKLVGTDTVRTLGDLWVLCEGKGNMPGGGIATTLMTLGYDPARKRFVGTFIGSMMTHLWVYDGQLDAAGKMLTLDTEGPSFTAEGKFVEGKMAKYKDVIEFKSDDYRTLSAHTLGDDGQWQSFMTAYYRRKK
jgi:hypothetical protein